MPANGRSAAAYRRSLREERGLFGDLYALSGRFVAAIRMKGLRLPEDLIGDDGLVAAWAHTDLGRDVDWRRERILARSEEHTSELQSLMRISYAVFCLKKKKHKRN